MNFTPFLFRHRKAFLSVTLLLCAIGLYCAAHLPVAIFPQLTVPRIVISADAGDIPIETTLAQVTRPLEAAASAIPGVVKVYSITTRGSNEVDVTFADGTDMQAALQRMQSRLADTRPTLPPEAQVTAALINPSIFPIMGYSLTSPTLDMTALRRLALYTLRPRLARLPGVAQVRITGGDIPEYLVAVRPERLAARGISLQDVQDALAKANGIASVGTFDRAYQRYEVLVSGLLHSPEDIGNVVVATKNAVPITVNDLGTVKLTSRPPTVLATGNGHPAVVVNIVKQPDANTIAVADAVHAELAQEQKTFPPGAQLSLFYDQSVIVHQSENSVVESIVIGGVLALIVLMLFLGDVRAATIVLLLLPLTLLITFGLMRLLGETLNIMTLGAMAIALGLVIDDGIVVVEAIVHAMEGGQERTEAIATGLRAVTPAMMGSSLTTMAAFLPLILLGGVTGQFFAPLALVMIATLGVSLALSLLLTPLLAGFLLRSKQSKAHSPARRTPFDRVADGYVRLLALCLRRKAIVLLLLIPTAIGGYVLFNHQQTGFFPEFDEGAFVIDYRMPAGTSLAETSRACQDVEALLARTPEVAAWSRLTGARSGSGLELTEPNEGDILVRLKDTRTRPSDDIISGLRDDIASVEPAFDCEMIQILQDGIGDIAGSPSPVEVKIFGNDQNALPDLAHKTGEIVTATPGIVDENDGVVETGPQTTVDVDSQRASRYGLTTDAVTSAVGAALRGSVATTLAQGEEGVDVRVQAAHSASTVETDLPGIPLATPTGGTVPLGTVATVTQQPGSAQVTRENQQPEVSVTARLEGRDLGSGVHDVQKRLARGLPLPPGVRIEYGGLYASQQQSFLQLAGVLALAVLLVSTLLLIQFRSFRQTLALLASAILSLIGVLLGLTLTGTPLNISSFTGAIMIVGIVTENGIVLFDYFNHLRHISPSRPLTEVMMEAGRLRLRPILMTTIGAILALMPLALGLGAGAAMQRPLAIAVIGGLSVSTVFILLVAPTLLLAMEGHVMPAGQDNTAKAHPDHAQ